MKQFLHTRPDDDLFGGFCHILRKKSRGLPLFHKFGEEIKRCPFTVFCILSCQTGLVTSCKVQMQSKKYTTIEVTFYMICEFTWSDLLLAANQNVWLFFFIRHRLTYTWYQDPGARRTGGSGNGLSQSFCRVDTTGEQILFVAFIPPETPHTKKQFRLDPAALKQ